MGASGSGVAASGRTEVFWLAGAAAWRAPADVQQSRGERFWFGHHLTGVGSETARHAGHADILRELVDGTTGR